MTHTSAIVRRLGAVPVERSQMRSFRALCLVLFFAVPHLRAATASSLPSFESVREAFGGKEGTLVVVDCSSGEIISSNAALAEGAFGPCSTFKIWNTLIGLEEGIIKEPDAPFWKWDRQQRSLSEWNKDQTLHEAFQASCVPAFQELARKIGPERMQAWLDKLGYGNKDQCGRPDSFWLPRQGEKTILITPEEQARMVCKLLRGELPVRASSIATLKEIMKSETTERGVLYGKTGSGLRGATQDSAKGVDYDMGWWVGFLEHDGKQFACACLVLGPGFSGKDAKEITAAFFRKNGML